MISCTMAVAAAGTAVSDRAEFAREARVARSAALVLDLIGFGFISSVVNSVYGVTQVTSGFITSGGGVSSTTTAVDWPWMTLLGVLYFAIPEAMFGASPGKLLMGLRVIRLDGRRLGIGSVIVRNVLKPVDFLPVLYLLGGVLVLATRGSQRLGDIAAGTTVVYRHRVREPDATRTSSRRARLVLAGALAVALLFTVAFDYFGRPPLIIQGDFNQRNLIGHLDSYSLGQPTWSVGSVTYPLYGRAGNQVCAGSIKLTWGFLGWNQSGSSLECVPS